MKPSTVLYLIGGIGAVAFCLLMGIYSTEIGNKMNKQKSAALETQATQLLQKQCGQIAKQATVSNLLTEYCTNCIGHAYRATALLDCGAGEQSYETYFGGGNKPVVRKTS